MWTPAEHLLAILTNVAAELTYVTRVVNTDEKHRKQVQRPTPIVRPGEPPPSRVELRPHPRHRRRIGTPIDPASIGGAPMDTTAQEVS